MSVEAEAELNWWIENVREAYVEQDREEPSVVIATDASTLGVWGAVCK